jgi:hypothetical protein
MPRRIEIELTSALADDSWTWRAAGAKKPNGVLNGSILPDGAKVGDILKVEMEQMLDGVEILSVVKGREKNERTNLLEILPTNEPFQEVIETRAQRGRDNRGKSGGDRDRPRRDRDDRSRRDRPPRDGAAKDGDGRDRRPRRDRPHFEAPPEVPQRPKPKRLRPGKARRNAVLAEIPEEQRPIAELVSQGMAAVRSRVKEENAKLEAEGKPTMPEASVVKMAEDLLPKLRVAEWLDRAEAAERQMDHLDLRDLRSVIIAGDDSIVARDETAVALNVELKASLVRRQAEELQLWIEDIDASLTVGRVIRALRLSSQPPKAGVMFPPELARRLGEAATQALQPDDTADRWIAVLEAAAFSPVRSLVAPTVAPATITDDLRATTLRLGPALPQIAALLGVEIPAKTPQPKPLRPTGRPDVKRKAGGKSDTKPSGRPERKPGATPGDKAAGKSGGEADRVATPPPAEAEPIAAVADEPASADVAPALDATPPETPATAESETAGSETAEPDTAGSATAEPETAEPETAAPATAAPATAAPATAEPDAIPADDSTTAESI